VGLAFTVSSDRVLSEAQVYIIWLWDLFLTAPPQGR
jgi:hypothetical protein